VLFAFSILLVFFGTMVQIDEGIGTAVNEYFRVGWAQFGFAFIPFQLLVKFGQIFFGLPKDMVVPGKFPFPGGWLIGALLLGNLLAAHIVRFKLGWKRSGILILHSGIVVLMVGELVTGKLAVEATMTIHEGESVNFVDATDNCELAITDTSDPMNDTVAVIPQRLLQQGGLIQDDLLPVDVEVLEYHKNSNLVQAKVDDENVRISAMGVPFRLVYRGEARGADADQPMDAPSVSVNFKEKGTGKLLGNKVLSLWYYPNYTRRIPVYQFPPQELNANGKAFSIELRPKRIYKPYNLRLEKFDHDKYAGTKTPKNFSSLVDLMDPERNVDRTVKISMNSPLRYSHEGESLRKNAFLSSIGLDSLGLAYGGETFYQSGWLGDDHGTILQVVRNPGWLLPYISCALVAFGMLIHFLIKLVGFLRMEVGQRKKSVIGISWSQRLPWMALGLALVGVYFLPVMISPSDTSDQMHIIEFGQLPVEDGGRYKPLDSVARTSLMLISNQQDYEDSAGQRHPAMEWLLDTMTSRSHDSKVIRIENDQVLGLLNLQPRPGSFRYSFAEIEPNLKVLKEQVDRIEGVDEKQLDLYEQKIRELAGRLQRYIELTDFLGLRVLPPSSSDAKDWESLQESVKRAKDANEVNPFARSFYLMLVSYAKGDIKNFNEELSSYHRQLAREYPAQTKAARFETYFNHVAPFLHCLVFYLVIFALTCVGFVLTCMGVSGMAQKLGRVAFWMLIGVLIMHTLGLIARIYISGRPPVTNLYSSAVFVAWAGVLLGVFIEVVFRLGIGTLMAAVLGFVATFFAHHLARASNGETLEVLQAVLDTNFWLSTHVICVSTGYAATAAAGILGILYLAVNVITPPLDRRFPQVLTKIIYGVLCFATFLSFTGTVLGGIWGDQSWGRFWGWDPKENGALMIVLWNALILHARWAGMIKPRGLALLAIAGIMLVGWSWIGTNQLGVGLHDYGFNKTLATIVAVTWVLMSLLIVAGLLPWQRWLKLNPIQG